MLQSKLFSAIIISLVSTGLYYTFNYEQEKYIINENEKYKKYGCIFMIIFCVTGIILSLNKNQTIVPIDTPKNISLNNTPPF